MSVKSQAIAYFNNGRKLFKSRLYKEALQQYQKSFDSDPTFYEVHFSISKTLIKVKDIEKGIAHFNRYSVLVPKSKKGRYAFGIAQALVEEKKNAEALSLIESLDIRFSEDQVFQYVYILLANNKMDDAISKLINIENTDRILQDYNNLFKSEISGSILKKLREENIVPRFFNVQLFLKSLKTSGMKHKKYLQVISDITKNINHIKSTKNINYEEEILKVEERTAQAQKILSQQLELTIKMKDIQLTKKFFSILKTTNFDHNALNAFEIKINQLKKFRRIKQIKIRTIICSIIAVFSLASYFAYNSIQKSNAYDKAIKSDSFEYYSRYLQEYGENDEIDKLREKKLYTIALSSNRGNDINKLSQHYPKSQFLKDISIIIEGDKSTKFNFFGIGSKKQSINLKDSITVQVPIGCKIGYSINKPETIPVNKTFIVISDMQIAEVLIDLKTLVFKDDFDSNMNGWNTFSETKKVYNRNKKKEVKLKNGSLNLCNEYSDNDFLWSSIYFPQIKRKDDFEIEVTIRRNNIDKGTFFIFGGTERAFNYVGFNKSGNYLYGYNNWDNNNEKWVKQSGNWKYNSQINQGSNKTNTLTVTKHLNSLTYKINESIIGQTTLKKWFGNRIGFGVNNNTNSSILNLKVYRLNNQPETVFTTNNIYFCWVDELNVRKDSSVKGDVITTIKEGEPVKYIGEVGGDKINATFRDIYSPDYYYKVELVDGTIGWVHGGALKYIKTSQPINFSEFKKIKPSSGSNITF